MSGPTPGTTQSLIQWVPGAISLRVKRPGREAAHLPPTNAEVKSGGAIPPLPYMSSWYNASLNKHRDNFAFTAYRQAQK
jgi:hypothetical protein